MIILILIPCILYHFSRFVIIFKWFRKVPNIPNWISTVIALIIFNDLYYCYKAIVGMSNLDTEIFLSSIIILHTLLAHWVVSYHRKMFNKYDK